MPSSVPSASASVPLSTSQSIASVSQPSVSESAYIPPGDCGACDSSNGYRPSQFDITWELVEQDPPSDLFDSYTETGGCYEFYQGPFTVNDNRGKDFNLINVNGLPAGSIQCQYGTVEYPLYSSSCAAAEPFDTTNCRAYLWLVKVGPDDYGLYVLIYWVNEGGPEGSLAEGGIWYGKGLASLNCFGSHTLDYLYMHNTETEGGFRFAPGPGFNYEWLDANYSPPVYEFTFPETITITPVL